MRALIGLFTLASILAAAPAIADETWKTSMGVIEWEKEIGDTAVFKLPKAGGVGVAARFYIEGLAADVNGGRGAYSGYWISASDEKVCEAELVGPDGLRSHTWGRIDLTFVRDGFPSDWTSKTGECLGEPNKVLNGVVPE